MSRGFVKEEDQEEPVLIPPRAALPVGAINYVTPNGLTELKKELENLEKERGLVKAEDETEKRRSQSFIDGKTKLLIERINAARLLKPEDQAKDEVRFGAKVKLKNLDTQQIQEFQIVGVDEADVKKQKIAFVAPIAKCITGRKISEIAEFNLGSEKRKFEIIAIEYI